MPYADYQVALSPTALQGPNGAAFQRALGLTKDWLVGRLKAGVKCRMPLVAFEDALSALGWERGLQKGITESPRDYAARLVGSWQAWQLAGTAGAILEQLLLAGYPNAAIAQQNNALFYRDQEGALQVASLPSYNGGPRRWTIDENGAQWSRFQVLLPLPMATDPETGENWNPISPLTANSLPSLPEMDKIRGIIADWKSANAICSGIVAVKTAGLWGHVPSNYALPVWQPETHYPAGTAILPKTPNGYVFLAGISNLSNISGDVEPAWSTVLSGLTNDGTVTWSTTDYAEGAGTWGDGSFWGGSAVQWSATIGSTT